ncbi:MAG: BtpA/SgcQ family protein [Melioribacteraceae bacterium]|nr:BtpA/SgcQ family protein [Melioribacteraceae bacterium]MCF8396508.1 BtpA/SgcQ family protein [Melioribacteraceae bacterium]
MKKFHNLFGKKKPVIGMIHLKPLPGTPRYTGNVKRVIDEALSEAKLYKSCGIDSIMIENMHDVPYMNRNVGPEITSLMSIIGYEIKKETNLPIGIQILAGANKEALAAANAGSLDFIRAEGFVFGHIADEGFIQSDAGEVLRYRKSIDAENIMIFSDIKKKHSSHSITDDTDIVETAKAAEFFMSDGVIITGIATGKEAQTNEIEAVKQQIDIPVLVGSGVTSTNCDKFIDTADGLIIGSYFKVDGKWFNPVDKAKVEKFMEKVRSFR